MSKATKRKHVTKELLDNYDLPTDNQQIVRIIGSRGNNLHEVETSTGEKYLASMPTKFRKNIWVKRGCFVVVEPIEEGKKVKAEIVHMLLKDQIKYVKSEGKWPEAFEDSQSEASDSGDDSDDLPPNPNRPDISFESDSSNESDSEESDSDEEKSGESATNHSGNNNSDGLINHKDTLEQS